MHHIISADPVNILSLTRYGSMGASSRLRTLQYIPYLQQQGFKVTTLPLFPNSYVRRLYAGKSLWIPAGFGYARRALSGALNRRPSLVWIEKELLPWLPFWIERLFLPNQAPYIVDYDDAVFHYYDQHPAKAVRRLLGGKIDALMRGAALVICGNEYLAARARQAGAQRVEVLPTAVDLARYSPTSSRSVGPVVIGWIGTPKTIGWLEAFQSVLVQMARRRNVRLVVIGSSVKTLTASGVVIEEWPWSENTEAGDIGKLDIGIMPLQDTPFARGKCGYKLIQYMACGKPVVASPIGANVEIVRNGVNGFLAATDTQWLQALDDLCRNEKIRDSMGRAGRRIVETNYCTQVTAPRLYAFLQETIQRYV